MATENNILFEETRDNTHEDIVRSVLGPVLLGVLGISAFEGYRNPHIHDYFKHRYRRFTDGAQRWMDSRDFLRELTGYKSGLESELSKLKSVYYNPKKREIVKPDRIVSSNLRGFPGGMLSSKEIEENINDMVERHVTSDIKRMENRLVTSDLERVPKEYKQMFLTTERIANYSKMAKVKNLAAVSDIAMELARKEIEVRNRALVEMAREETIRKYLDRADVISRNNIIALTGSDLSNITPEKFDELVQTDKLMAKIYRKELIATERGAKGFLPAGPYHDTKRQMLPQVKSDIRSFMNRTMVPFRPEDLEPKAALVKGIDERNKLYTTQSDGLSQPNLNNPEVQNLISRGMTHFNPTFPQTRLVRNKSMFPEIEIKTGLDRAKKSLENVRYVSKVDPVRRYVGDGHFVIDFNITLRVPNKEPVNFTLPAVPEVREGATLKTAAHSPIRTNVVHLPIRSAGGRLGQSTPLPRNVSTNILRVYEHHGKKIIEDVIERGTEAGLNTAKSFIRPFVGETSLITGAMSDIFSMVKVIDDQKQFASGKKQRMSMHLWNAAQSYRAMRSAKDTGAFTAVYDLETFTPNWTAGTQPTVRSPRTRVWQATVAIVDPNGNVVDTRAFWADTAGEFQGVLDPGNKQGAAYQQLKAMGYSDSNIESVRAFQKSGQAYKNQSQLFSAMDKYVMKATGGKVVTVGKGSFEFDKKIFDLHAPPNSIFRRALHADVESMFRAEIKDMQSFKLEDLYEQYFPGKIEELKAKTLKTFSNQKVYDKNGKLHTISNILADGDPWHFSGSDVLATNALMSEILLKHGAYIGHEGSFMRDMERFNRNPMGLGRKMRTMNAELMGAHFYGTPEASKGLKKRWSLDTDGLNPTSSSEGVKTVIDYIRMSPFGVLNNVARQKYQNFKGLRFHKTSAPEKNAYRDAFKLRMFTPYLRTSWYDQSQNFLQGLGIEQFKDMHQKSMNVRVAYINNVLTLDEGIIVDRGLTKYLTGGEQWQKSYQFDNPVHHMTDAKFKGQQGVANPIVNQQIMDFRNEKVAEMRKLENKLSPLELKQYGKAGLEELAARNVVEKHRAKAGGVLTKLYTFEKGTRIVENQKFDRQHPAMLIDVIDIPGKGEVVGFTLKFDSKVDAKQNIKMIGTGFRGTFMSILDLNKKTDDKKIGLMVGNKFLKRGEYGELYEVLVNKAVSNLISDGSPDSKRKLEQISRRLDMGLERKSADALSWSVIDTNAMITVDEAIKRQSRVNMESVLDVLNISGDTWRTRKEVATYYKVIGATEEEGRKRMAEFINRASQKEVDILKGMDAFKHMSYQSLLDKQKQFMKAIMMPEVGRPIVFQTIDVPNMGMSHGIVGVANMSIFGDELTARRETRSHLLKFKAMYKSAMYGQFSDSVLEWVDSFSGGKTREESKKVKQAMGSVKKLMNMVFSKAVAEGSSKTKVSGGPVLDIATLQKMTAPLFNKNETKDYILGEMRRLGVKEGAKEIKEALMSIPETVHFPENMTLDEAAAAGELTRFSDEHKSQSASLRGGRFIPKELQNVPHILNTTPNIAKEGVFHLPLPNRITIDIDEVMERMHSNMTVDKDVIEEIGMLRKQRLKFGKISFSSLPVMSAVGAYEPLRLPGGVSYLNKLALSLNNLAKSAINLHKDPGVTSRIASAKMLEIEEEIGSDYVEYLLRIGGLMSKDTLMDKYLTSYLEGSIIGPVNSTVSMAIQGIGSFDPDAFKRTYANEVLIHKSLLKQITFGDNSLNLVDSLRDMVKSGEMDESEFKAFMKGEKRLPAFGFRFPIYQNPDVAIPMHMRVIDDTSLLSKEAQKALRGKIDVHWKAPGFHFSPLDMIRLAADKDGDQAILTAYMTGSWEDMKNKSKRMTKQMTEDMVTHFWDTKEFQSVFEKFPGLKQYKKGGHFAQSTALGMAIQKFNDGLYGYGGTVIGVDVEKYLEDVAKGAGREMEFVALPYKTRRAKPHEKISTALASAGLIDDPTSMDPSKGLIGWMTQSLNRGDNAVSTFRRLEGQRQAAILGKQAIGQTYEIAKGWGEGLQAIANGSKIESVWVRDKLRAFQEITQDIISAKHIMDPSDARRLTDTLKHLRNVGTTKAQDFLTMSKIKGGAGISPENYQMLKHLDHFNQELSFDNGAMAARRLLSGKGHLTDFLSAIFSPTVGDRVSDSLQASINGVVIDGDSRPLGHPEYGKPSFHEKLRRRYGEKKVTSFKQMAAGAGIAAAAYLAGNFFRPNQLSNSLSPLDLFVNLGDQAGRGGEMWDYYGGGRELPGNIPLDVPEYSWDRRVHITPNSPTNIEKQSRRLVKEVFESLGAGDPASRSPIRPFLRRPSYFDKRSSIDTQRFYEQLRRSSLVMRGF